MIHRMIICGLTVSLFAVAICFMVSLVRPVETGYRKVPIATDT